MDFGASGTPLACCAASHHPGVCYFNITAWFVMSRHYVLDLHPIKDHIHDQNNLSHKGTKFKRITCTQPYRLYTYAKRQVGGGHIKNSSA